MDWLVLVLYIVGSYALVAFGVKYVFKSKSK